MPARLLPRLPGDLATPRVGAALILLLLALGLPWGVVGPESVYVRGWYSPGTCVLQADGYLWCNPGYLAPSYLLPGQGAPMAGYASSARVFLVAAVLILAWALYRRTTPALGWVIGLTAAAVALSGTALRTGAIAAILAVVLLVFERRSVLRSAPP